MDRCYIIHTHLTDVNKPDILKHNSFKLCSAPNMDLNNHWIHC